MLTSKRIEVENEIAAQELFYARGWSDGLPIVPPTPDRVSAFLDYVAVEPDQVVANIQERGKVITAEKLAINAVMAGCRPEYMPVLLAAADAMSAPEYHFNTLASQGSPAPLLIVNGPIVKELGFNSGMYLFGPGCRTNATIGRAISLMIANCAGARVGEVQRGQWGNPLRFGANCIAEDESTDWTPLHVQEGFDRNTSTVTVINVYPILYQLFAARRHPEGILDSIADAIATSDFFRGTYVLLIARHYVTDNFIANSWTKNDVRNYLFENTKRSVADLKRRGLWLIHASFPEAYTGLSQAIEPGDEQRFAYVFKPTELDEFMQSSSSMNRRADIFVVVAGGDSGMQCAFLLPYGASTNPVTRPIRKRR